MSIGFLATEGYYVDHMASIWLALPKNWRGPFFVGPRAISTAKRYKISNIVRVPKKRNLIVAEMKRRHKGPVMTASWANWRLVERAGLPAPTLPHGQGGQGNSNSSWISKADKVDLMMVPAEYGRLEGINCPLIHGQPKLDRWFGHKVNSKPPVLAISFRWRECHSAVEYYRPFVKKIKEQAQEAGIHILGHGHPLKFENGFRQLWEEHSIECTPLFEDVLARADVYAADCSSSSFEFVGLDRPVIFLEDPKIDKYNFAARDNFASKCGIINKDPLKLIEDTLIALSDPIEISDGRKEVAKIMFGDYKGEASKNAAQVLIDFYDKLLR